MDNVESDLAWRVMFWTGALPALLLIYVRRNVKDAPQVTERLADKRARVPLSSIFKGDLARKTFFASLLATGVQGGYYTIATWLPTYLKTERGLTVVGTGGYLSTLITGAFCGYLTGGYLTDRLGRKKSFALFAVLSAGLLMAYINIPQGQNNILLVLGFPLGFCFSAISAGFGSFLAELYPSAVRGTGQSFTYNVGRAAGAIFPTAVGFRAAGVGGALIYGPSATPSPWSPSWGCPRRGAWNSSRNRPLHRAGPPFRRRARRHLHARTKQTAASSSLPASPQMAKPLPPRSQSEGPPGKRD